MNLKDFGTTINKEMLDGTLPVKVFIARALFCQKQFITIK